MGDLREVRELFDEVVGLTPEEQERVLAMSPPTIASRVRRFLEAHDATEPALADSEIEAVFGELAGPETSLVGERLGPYQLLSEVGSGGMGTVYEAEQSGMLSRRVAVKAVRLGLSQSDAISRFENECAALARMSHPNIAGVYDARVTETGQPYIVMELVSDALPIVRYCDQHRLDLDARLRLFRQLCAAVNHAHENGVVHRDIKPSNVLVTGSPEAAVVKVIDFGIARALDRVCETGLESTPDAERSGPSTETCRWWAGTPEYMAPEQAAAKSGTLDHRADIYSLGVLLYELLTGVRPFELAGCSLDVAIERVRHETPPTMRVRLRAQTEDAEDRARRRGLSRRALVAALRGDLQCIVSTAIRRSPEERYSTARELSEDVGRTLRGDAIEVRREDSVYRAARWAARHHVGLAAAAAVVGYFVLTAAVWTYVSVDERREEAAVVSELSEEVERAFESALSSTEVAAPAEDVLEEPRRAEESEPTAAEVVTAPPTPSYRSSGSGVASPSQRSTAASFASRGRAQAGGAGAGAPSRRRVASEANRAIQGGGSAERSARTGAGSAPTRVPTRSRELSTIDPNRSTTATGTTYVFLSPRVLAGQGGGLENNATTTTAGAVQPRADERNRCGPETAISTADGTLLDLFKFDRLRTGLEDDCAR